MRTPLGRENPRGFVDAILRPAPDSPMSGMYNPPGPAQRRDMPWSAITMCSKVRPGSRRFDTRPTRCDRCPTE